MRLYFLRHGKAESRLDWIESDALRPLTPQGEAAVVREAKWMRAHDIQPDAIVTSPLERARRTAELVADELGMSEWLCEDERLAHGLDVLTLAEVLAQHERAEAVMLVGHEPDMSATVSELIGGGAVVLKKGGLARVDLEVPRPGGAELVWLLAPSLMGGR